MDLGQNLGSEDIGIKLMAARAVGAYVEGTPLSNKLQELLRKLIIENLKEGATDEAMEDLLYEECTTKKLDPDEVMKHFIAISERLQDLLNTDSHE